MAKKTATKAQRAPSALVAVDIEGIVTQPSERGRFARRLRQLLARLETAPLGARLTFADQNGPKGGLDVSCAMAIRLPRRPAIRVTHVADTTETAFAGALDTLERQLTRFRQRERTARRRPKKYYAARRLLTPEGEEATGRTRAARRRR